MGAHVVAQKSALGPADDKVANLLLPVASAVAQLTKGHLHTVYKSFNSLEVP